jgi:hypothetical protein
MTAMTIVVIKYFSFYNEGNKWREEEEVIVVFCNGDNYGYAYNDCNGNNDNND